MHFCAQDDDEDEEDDAEESIVKVTPEEDAVRPSHV
jgi:hypothetical protein